jgi:hypothetical protein
LLGAAKALQHVAVIVWLVVVAIGAPIEVSRRDRLCPKMSNDPFAGDLLGGFAVQPIATGALAKRVPSTQRVLS